MQWIFFLQFHTIFYRILSNKKIDKILLKWSDHRIVWSANDLKVFGCESHSRRTNKSLPIRWHSSCHRRTCRCSSGPAIRCLWTVRWGFPAADSWPQRSVGRLWCEPYPHRTLQCSSTPIAWNDLSIRQIFVIRRPVQSMNNTSVTYCLICWKCFSQFLSVWIKLINASLIWHQRQIFSLSNDAEWLMINRWRLKLQTQGCFNIILYIMAFSAEFSCSKLTFVN